MWGRENSYMLFPIFYKFIVSVKSTVNTINNTGFMDEFPYYCILFYGIQSYFVLFCNIEIKTMKYKNSFLF